MRELAQEDLTSLEAERTSLEADIQVALLPSDPDDDRNVIVEVRAGTGGEEAALFAAELVRLYTGLRSAPTVKPPSSASTTPASAASRKPRWKSRARTPTAA